MDLRGKSFVVIGGAGFIGSHTVDRLLQEDVKKVVIFDNFVRGVPANLESALKDGRTSIFEAGGDITQTDILNHALEKADGVFHFAALWLLQCHEYPRSAFDVNVRGTFNVLEACIHKGIQRLVYSSSASVYGDAVEIPMTEDHPFNNKTFYGATKIAGEAMARALHHRYGLPFVGLRYMNVYGPRQDHRGAYVGVMMKMIERARNHESLRVFGDGSQAYDFVYVRDCAEANVLAMKADTADAFYNVGTGVKTSVLEVARLMIRVTGSRSQIEFVPEGPTFVRHRIGSPLKAERELGFKAQVPLEEGLQELVRWWDAGRGSVSQPGRP